MSLLLACGDDDSGSGISLSKISIADAAIIYQRTSTTRAANGSDEDEGYWKIDRQGNETRILLYDKAGNPTDVKIEKIEKLNEKLLLIKPYGYRRVIADLQTEKLYEVPDFFTTPVTEGADGMLYFIDYPYTLRRLDPTNFTIEQALPDGQKCEKFMVSKNGTIYYIYESNKFKMPNGRIIPYDSHEPFIAGDGDFYLCHPQENKFYKLVPRSDGKIEQEYICQFDDPTSESGFTYAKNGKNGKDLIVSWVSDGYKPDGILNIVAVKLYEFDGSRLVAKKTYERDQPYYDLMGNFSGNVSLWELFCESYHFPDGMISEVNLGFSNNKMYSIDLDSYSIESVPYTFPTSEYELYETTADEANRRLVFTALRYEDGKVVIGEISAQGRISIINEKESSNKIINLIALN